MKPCPLFCTLYKALGTENLKKKPKKPKLFKLSWDERYRYEKKSNVIYYAYDISFEQLIRTTLLSLNSFIIFDEKVPTFTNCLTKQVIEKAF